ncbi:NAD kinase [Rhodocyclus purpureus]|uniref:NAD kinase n=1 Tax=Rhodocyclus purpureus TaxID=1067 RepID=UPI001913482B|nr:NAD kinase [Rhodocyclus purpureus]MBK5913438.1 NAD kinase [Rhodocyclus purpureus]
METGSALADAPQSPQTIALIGRFATPEASASLAVLARYLEARGIRILVEAGTARSAAGGELAGWPERDFTAIGAEADLAIVLGGDGTMLHTARELAPFATPLVGVNQGRLGFMTDIARSEMIERIDELLAGRFLPETRMLLECEVLRDGERVAGGLALNEVVVDKGEIGRMIEFALFINGEFIYNLRADGLIVATPTGSTAYSLSANGPILHPQVSGIALVPLCPHALTNRPVIIGDSAEITIRIAQASSARAHLDAQLTVDLRPDDRVLIRRSGHSIRFLHPPGYSYFAMLRAKLHWSESPQGRAPNS